MNINTEKLNFNIEILIKNKKGELIENKDIFDWFEGKYPLRLIQKWAKKHGVDAHRKDGRKYYIWSVDKLLELKEWHEKGRWVREPKPKELPQKPVFPYIKLKDVINEIEFKNGETQKAKEKKVQRYCVKIGVPKEKIYGRYYFAITEKDKPKIIDFFKNEEPTRRGSFQTGYIKDKDKKRHLYRNTIRLIIKTYPQ